MIYKRDFDHSWSFSRENDIFFGLGEGGRDVVDFFFKEVTIGRYVCIYIRIYMYMCTYMQKGGPRGRARAVPAYFIRVSLFNGSPLALFPVYERDLTCTGDNAFYIYAPVKI